MVKSTRTISFSALSLLLALSGTLQTQVRLSVPCSVRIRPAAADYDLASEVSLRGVIVGREGRLLLLQLRVGLVRIDAGSSIAASHLSSGTQVQVVAAKLQEEGRQRLLVREIRTAEATLVLRDALGVPTQL